FINDILTFDDQQSKQLMDFAAKGNTVFIAANSISGALNANLDFTVTGKRNLLKQKVSVNFFNPRLKTTTAVVFHEHYPTHFDQINPNATALSFLTLDDDEEPKINFISIPHGEGKFLIHTTPEAFSNFNLLHENQEYAAAAMSYVNAEKIYWDEYIKSGRRFISSPLRFILGNQALTWSYYLVMSGLFLFVLFQGKRQQRPIPIIEPQKNSSVEFTKTVGSLYFQHRDFSNAIMKKITFFLERVRSQLLIDTYELSDEFIHKLATKSGKNLSSTKELISLIVYLRDKSIHTEEELIKLNKKIEDFNL
ncbi:MAG TPA: DUF4350 domain-containing protein, partial [Flavobacteriaceae bacterium]|nr:DUF4350 domain-containing protein [Flavobacteriaceae bacterium]